MEEDDPMRLTARATGDDPREGLEAVAALGRLLERLERLQVTHARRAGWSWQEIATSLGVSKQAAHKKHGRSVRG
jgi:hypothetical protein